MLMYDNWAQINIFPNVGKLKYCTILVIFAMDDQWSSPHTYTQTHFFKYKSHINISWSLFVITFLKLTFDLFLIKMYILFYLVLLRGICTACTVFPTMTETLNWLSLQASCVWRSFIMVNISFLWPESVDGHLLQCSLRRLKGGC